MYHAESAMLEWIGLGHLCLMFSPLAPLAAVDVGDDAADHAVDVHPCSLAQAQEWRQGPRMN